MSALAYFFWFPWIRLIILWAGNVITVKFNLMKRKYNHLYYSHYSSIKPENLQKAKQGSEMESWLALTVLSKDIVKFDTCLFDLCLNTFWSHLRSLGINTQQFGQCLSYFSEQINIKRKSRWSTNASLVYPILQILVMKRW